MMLFLSSDFWCEGYPELVSGFLFKGRNLSDGMPKQVLHDNLLELTNWPGFVIPHFRAMDFQFIKINTDKNSITDSSPIS